MAEQPINVLLVDDDEEDFMLVRDILRDVKRQKYNIKWEPNYTAALKIIRTETFDIILIDFVLGKYSGMDLLKAVRLINEHVPVIMFTGLGSEEVDMQAMAAGASDYIVKGQFDGNMLGRSIRYSISQALTQKKLVENEQSLRNAEKSAITGRIAQIIAHEVRNPLTNVRLALDQMRDEIQNPTEIVETLANLIERNCDRINSLITSLLDSTKFLQLNFEYISLNDLIEESIQYASDRIKLKHASIKREFTTEDCKVYVDKEKIKIALLNIIINATEAIEEHKGVLTFKTAVKSGKGIATISDNGSGIDPEHLGRIFEPYFSQKENGKGLGLTSTQNIILNHKGDIKVESQRLKGTSFIISFDLARENKPILTPLNG